MRSMSIKSQTAFITGATSGIGAAVAKLLAQEGVNLILTGRRQERLSEMKETYEKKYSVSVQTIALDVQNKNDVKQRIGAIQDEIDFLINSAGLALGTDPIQSGKIEQWDQMIDTNFKGLLYVTREILPRMLKKDKGHIVNIASVAGHDCYPGGNIYSATKHAVVAISQSLRLDLQESSIRVSQVSPGAVETEFSRVRWQDVQRAKQFYQDFDPLTSEDIADNVLYCITRPPHVNISEIIVWPQAQSSVTQICRKGKRDHLL